MNNFCFHLPSAKVKVKVKVKDDEFVSLCGNVYSQIKKEKEKRKEKEILLP